MSSSALAGPASRRTAPARPRRASASFTAVLSAAVLVLTSACAPGYTGYTTPSPDRIPELEQRLDARPGDLTTLVQLGAAYRVAQRPQDAVTVLETARGVAPDDAAPVVLLGLAYEDLERYADARSLYETYLRERPDGPAADRIRDRISLVRRAELRQAVARAVEREAELTDRPTPTTIAVFPFVWDGSDPELEPLRWAVAGMITTDLAEVGRFTLLERVHVDALMDEVRLGQSGLVDPGTAARGGRLLGAGRVVQGRLGGTEESFAFDAAVVALTGAATPDVRAVEASDALERLFEMEKRIVLGIFDAMGVTLTAAERERVMQRRTDNLQALLAYGRGLEASANGDFEEAAQHFQRAVALDPSFEQAETEAEEAEALASAEDADMDVLMAEAAPPAAPAAPEPVDLAEIAAGAATRDPGAEVTGTEGVTPTTDLIIILTRPGGGQ